MGLSGSEQAALVLEMRARQDKFEQDMRKIGAIADRASQEIEDQFNKRTGNIFKGSFLGNFASRALESGLTAASSFVSQLIEDFKQLERTAKLTGESMQEIFGTAKSAGKFGASSSDVFESTRNLATLLNELQRSPDAENSLSKLFDAQPNGPAIRNATGEVISFNEALSIVADLVRNARTEIDKIDIAKLAGQSQGMVRYLEQGGEAISRLRQEAAATAPDMQKLANTAKDFEEILNRISELFKGFAVVEFQALRRDIANTIDELAGMLELLAKITSFVPFSGGTAGEVAKVAAQWRDYANSLRLATQETERARPRSGNVAGGGTTSRDSRAPLTRLPSDKKDDGGDTDEAAFNRALSQMRRRLGLLEADTAAVGQSEAARARLRAEEAAYQYLESRGIDVTHEHMDAVEALGERIEQQAGRFQRAQTAFQGLNDAVKFGGNQLADVLDRAMQKGAKFGDIMNDVLHNIQRQLLAAAITGEGAFAKLLGLSSTTPGGVGGLAGALAGIIGTPRAAGGPVSRGMAYPVGERGPELFVPRTAGVIVPNHALGGGSGPVKLNLINNGTPLTGTAKSNSDGSIDVILDAIEARSADRLARGQGPLAKVIKKPPLRG